MSWYTILLNIKANINLDNTYNMYISNDVSLKKTMILNKSQNICVYVQENYTLITELRHIYTL